MTAQAPFPQPQAPAKAEHPFDPTCGCDRCGWKGITNPPRAFGWCGCTEALPCHEHERRTK